VSPVRVIPLALRPLSIIACTAAAAGVLAGCSGRVSGAPTASSPAAAPVATGTPLTETSTDNKFGTTAYSVAAGQTYTLTLTNTGEAVHNWHLIGLKGPDGKEIATPLTAGGKSTSVTFVITRPGTYHFQCDVHPTDMTGTIIAQ
jgi:plastocyanin